MKGGLRDKGARALGWVAMIGGGSGLRLEGVVRVGVGVRGRGKEEAKLPATLQCWQS